MIFISSMERKDKFKTYRQIIMFAIVFEVMGVFFNGFMYDLMDVLKSFSGEGILWSE